MRYEIKDKKDNERGINMAENIILLVILGIVSIIMIGIGISQMKRKTPVGFYTGEIPPKEEELTDVVQWNKKHGRMCIIYGCSIICSYFIGMILRESLIAPYIIGGVIVVGVLIMMFYHSRLKKEYIN